MDVDEHGEVEESSSKRQECLLALRFAANASLAAAPPSPAPAPSLLPDPDLVGDQQAATLPVRQPHRFDYYTNPAAAFSFSYSDGGGSNPTYPHKRKSSGLLRPASLDGRSDALSSANLDRDLGDAGADSACRSGILGFLMGAGADGGVTGAGSGGSCSGLVRQRRVGVAGLLPPLEKKPPTARGLASWGRRFLALASRSWSSSRWMDVLRLSH